MPALGRARDGSCSRSPRAWSWPTRPARCRSSRGCTSSASRSPSTTSGPASPRWTTSSGSRSRRSRSTARSSRRWPTDARDAAIVRCTIDLARSLGLRVVAEGVETPDVRARLTTFGCDQAQGYSYSRALPAAEFAAWLAARDHTRWRSAPDGRQRGGQVGHRGDRAPRRRPPRSSAGRRRRPVVALGGEVAHVGAGLGRRRAAGGRRRRSSRRRGSTSARPSRAAGRRRRWPCAGAGWSRARARTRAPTASAPAAAREARLWRYQSYV